MDSSRSNLVDIRFRNPAAPLVASRKTEYDSHALLQGGREVLIHHGDQTYRLYHTRNDKLILVK